MRVICLLYIFSYYDKLNLIPIKETFMKTLLVTGSSGLIGSEVCLYFAVQGWRIHGVDNNQRAIFFGAQGDTRWNQQRLQSSIQTFVHHELDIRDRQGVLDLLQTLKPDAIVHTAAQPSHDRAAAIPFDDFDTNAVGTLNLLEAVRQACPESPFVHMSTNKVYGDLPNTIQMEELETRWDYRNQTYAHGIPETFSIDQSKHSLFGASKVAADVMVQEYGRYFNMPTACLRGGCLTGPNHSGVELHGFLSYLVKCNLEEREYKIFGYKGKQVRDNIHSLDVARFIEAFINAPRVGEVYNIGGGKANTCSILEAFALTEKYSDKAMKYTYIAENRIGDHICYYSDLRKMRSHYPNWDISVTLEETIQQIVKSWKQRMQREQLATAMTA
jgi:CDP-paratose 2-epimerase